MPNIRPYDSPTEGIRPTERGVDAAQTAARRIAQAYDTAGSAEAATGQRIASGAVALGEVAVQYMEHREISQGAVALANKQSQLTDAWNKTVKTADPNDPTVAAKFREEVLEPELEKLREGFATEGGQKWAQSRVDSLRSHMFDKSAADMGTLAAAAAAVNVKQLSNSTSNTAMSDPSSVPHLLEGVDSSVGAMIDSSPNLKGAAAARARMQLSEEMRENIVKAGAIGAIQNARDPEAEAERWAAKYPKYISGADLKTLSANARQQIRADRMDRAYSDHLKKQDAERISDATETSYLQKLYSDDPKQQAEVSTKSIVNDPGLTRQAKERMIGIVNRELKPETAAQVSNSNAMDLLNRLRLPEGDPMRISDLNPIYEARIGGKLNRVDFEALKKEFAEVRTPEGERLTVRKNEFLKAAAPTIDKSNPLMGKIDQDGKLNAYLLTVDLDKKIDEYRKAGKNPYDLMDPSKPDYMGTPAALQPYQKPIQDSIRDRLLQMRSGNLTGDGKTITGIEVRPAPVKPRQPNETPAAYLKRIGAQ